MRIQVDLIWVGCNVAKIDPANSFVDELKLFNAAQFDEISGSDARNGRELTYGDVRAVEMDEADEAEERITRAVKLLGLSALNIMDGLLHRGTSSKRAIKNKK